jgi:two-component system response regulator
VLLVDRDPGAQSLVRRALSSAGFPTELRVIEDGDAALDYLLRVAARAEPAPRPALLLLDLDLPDSHGLRVLAAARSDARLSTLPIVVISTSSREEDIEECYRLGANAYVVKPDGAARFIDAIGALSAYWLEVNVLPRA